MQNEINDYGIDDNGPLPNPAWSEDVSTPDAIEVPELHLPISIDDVDQHLSQIDPLAPSENFGIDIYLHVLGHLNSILSTTESTLQQKYLYINEHCYLVSHHTAHTQYIK